MRVSAELAFVFSEEIFDPKVFTIVMRFAVNPVRATIRGSSKPLRVLAFASDGSSKVEVKFSMNKCVPFGCNIAIVGSSESLGAWDQKESVALSWTDGDIWTATCEIPRDSVIEYKYLIKGGHDLVEWQSGSNCSLRVPEDAKAVSINDTWEGGQEVVVAPLKVSLATAVEGLVEQIIPTPEVKVPDTVESLEPLATADKNCYSNMTIKSLKSKLEELNLPTTGRKEDLIARLTKFSTK